MKAYCIISPPTLRTTTVNYKLDTLYEDIHILYGQARYTNAKQSLNLPHCALCLFTLSSS